MKTAEGGLTMRDPQALVGMDAYSKDNQYIGSVYRLLPILPESEMAAELVSADATDESGRMIGPEHVEINGIGTMIQANLTVGIPALSIDWNGRRVTVPMTLAEIEAMPHDSRENPIA